MLSLLSFSLFSFSDKVLALPRRLACYPLIYRRREAERVFDIHTCFLRQLLFHLRPMTRGDRCSYWYCSRNITRIVQLGGNSFPAGGWITNGLYHQVAFILCAVVSVFLLSSKGKMDQVC